MLDGVCNPVRNVLELKRTSAGLQTPSGTAQAWLTFLDNQLGQQSFTAGEGRCLIDAPYRPDVAIDVKALLKLCRLLLKKGQPQGIAPTIQT